MTANQWINGVEEQLGKLHQPERPLKCLHEQMDEEWKRRTGGKGPKPIHMISCPCPKCTPYYM